MDLYELIVEEVLWIRRPGMKLRGGVATHNRKVTTHSTS